MDEIDRQRQFEDQFLGQIRARATALIRGGLPADRVEFEPMPDGVDGVRATLTRLEVFDRDLLHRMPGTAALQLRFRRSALAGLIRPTVSRLRAQVLAPIRALAKGETPGPIDRDQVLDALARYDVLPKNQRPTGVVYASPTGFTEGAKALIKSYGPPTLILMGGREDGGWDTVMPPAVAKTNWAKLFELETQDDLLKRLTYHLDQSADLLDSRGLAIDELSEKLGVDRAKTEALIRRAVRARSNLMTVVHDGKVHVCSTPLAEEGNAMSIWSRIRKLLRLKPTVGERVRDLTAQRVRLEQQRHDIDRRVNSLEAEEVECVKKGAASKTAVEKRQLAGKLARLRRELGRHKGQAGMLSKQIDILGTHVHHITLTERGKQIELPSSEELTQQAAQAEQMVTELSANAELAAGIEISGVSEGLSDEEEAILAEFEAAAGGDESTKSTAPTETVADEASSRERIDAPPAADAEPVDTPPSSDPPTTARGSTEKGESARPELS